jgi:hypothetical protein
MATPTTEFKTLAVLHKVAMADSPSEAQNLFQENHSLLADWKVLFASQNDLGSIKLENVAFSSNGFMSPLFRGKSLFVIDDQTGRVARQEFCVGFGNLIDSNCASYIRSLTYNISPSNELVKFGCELANFFQFGNGRNELVPFLHLWEALRYENVDVTKCIETLAAVYALKMGAPTMDDDWRMRFYTKYREESEAFAWDYFSQMKAMILRNKKIIKNKSLALVELMLVRTKIIQMSSKKSSEHKIRELVKFMHDDLNTMCVRELIICVDILQNGNSSLTKKLHSLEGRANNALRLLENCAWDIFLFRVIDEISGTKIEAESNGLLPQGTKSNFTVANILSFDVNVRDILNLTSLRAVAIHSPTNSSFPFYFEDMLQWLELQIGGKRMTGIEPLFDQKAFDTRAKQRESIDFHALLHEDKARLMRLLTSKAV